LTPSEVATLRESKQWLPIASLTALVVGIALTSIALYRLFILERHVSQGRSDLRIVLSKLRSE
jgi:multisubunit Na+/H+ antiporter MnhC subunit